LENRKTSDKVGTDALVDSGAGGKFIDKTYAIDNGFELKPLRNSVKVYKVDYTPNKKLIL